MPADKFFWLQKIKNKKIKKIKKILTVWGIMWYASRNGY